MSDEVIISPKRPPPHRKDWRLYDRGRVLGYPAEKYLSKYGHVVITAVEVAEDDHRESVGPEFHISVTKFGERLPADEIPQILKLFDMEGADEDNHVPGGKARNFWKPVAEKFSGFVCPCKQNEPAVIESDYVWRPAP
ncbi:MAG TPA: hypothetical protein PKH39_18600 [Woeseiaceae bacterium]|nr:hypothetical protein [Woeseiaceae bacterium]